MSNKVTAKYSDFNANEIEEISMSLFNNVLFDIALKDNDVINLSMKDIITSNVEVGGSIDYDTLNVLIKGLVMMKKQIERKGYDEV